MSPVLQNALRTSLILFLFALVGTGVLAFTYAQTQAIIEKSAQKEKLALINQVMPKALYDNDLLAAYRELSADPLLGTRRPSGMWLATRGGQPAGIVLETIAPEGYSGDIYLLVGIDAKGMLTGVRVVQHRETPGLGDYIQLAKSPWVLQFDGKSYHPDRDGIWKVKKDGGEFDSRAGATITPRAIVKSVREALKYFQLHHERLLQPIEAPKP
jgi:electron transport complex protein RnfG